LALAMPNSNHSSMKRMIYYNQRWFFWWANQRTWL